MSTPVEGSRQPLGTPRKRTARKGIRSTKQIRATARAKAVAESVARVIGRGIVSNKYGARRTVYNGMTFDSAGEAEYAAKLDLRCKAGELVDWERPKPVVLMQAQQARGRITYRPDFYVVPATGTGYYVDYKGSSVTETAVWKLKVKLWRSAVPHELRVVYASGEEKIVATGNECFTRNE